MTRPRFVSINQSNIDNLVQRWPWVRPSWPKQHHYLDSPERTATARFLEASINFYSGRGEWQFFDSGRWLNGYFGLVAALKRFFLQYPIFLDRPDTIYRLDRQDFEAILQGQGRLSLLAERLTNWQEISLVLDKRFDNSIAKLISQANHSAPQLVKLIVQNFPSFREHFLKRAQLFVSDLWGCLDNEDLGAFDNIDELTAFADQKIPQILNHFEIISYNADLASKINTQRLIAPQSTEEQEIRAATILAVDMISEAYRKQGYEAIPSLVDNWLWELNHTIELCNLPHQTITTDY